MPAPTVDLTTWLDQTTLTSLVRQSVGHDAVALSNWECQPLHGGAGQGLGVYRVQGTATVDGLARSWSLILKVLPAEATGDSSGWHYPPREWLAYQSGRLADLPGGLAAPRCFGSSVGPEGHGCLWLEEVSDEAGATWSLSDYGLVARRLGQFNGAYLAERPLPADAWLSRRWLKGWVEENASAVAQLVRLAEHPIVQQVYQLSAALCYPLGALRLMLPALHDPGAQAAMARVLGAPAEAFIAGWRELFARQLAQVQDR